MFQNCGVQGIYIYIYIYIIYIYIYIYIMFLIMSHVRDPTIVCDMFLKINEGLGLRVQGLGFGSFVFLRLFFPHTLERSSQGLPLCRMRISFGSHPTHLPIYNKSISMPIYISVPRCPLETLNPKP